MQPSLPCSWFDLCAIPLHDAPRPAENLFITQGVLNRVRPGAAKDPRQGLILIVEVSGNGGGVDAGPISSGSLVGRGVDFVGLLPLFGHFPGVGGPVGKIFMGPGQEAQGLLIPVILVHQLLEDLQGLLHRPGT